MRRSVSSCDSPGPREPMPPWVRDRWVHRRVRRGSWYSSWASSTWSRPSWVCAWSAKMSRISRLRSMTLTPNSPSRVRCWAGDSSSSAMSTSKPVSRLADSSSSALPLPTYQFGSTWRRFCHSAPTTSAPAVVARLASSVRDSSADHPSSAPTSTATRKAFSISGSRSISCRDMAPKDSASRVVTRRETEAPGCRGRVAVVSPAGDVRSKGRPDADRRPRRRASTMSASERNHVACRRAKATFRRASRSTASSRVASPSATPQASR